MRISVNKVGCSAILASGLVAMTACGPAPEHVLVVYSPLDPAVLEYAEDRFEEMWANVDVRMVRLDDAAALERIGSGMGDGDVWWGAEVETLQAAAADTLLDPFEPQWAATDDNPFAGLDQDERWHVVMASPFVIAFDREVTQLSRAPRDWVDLAHLRWREKVLYPDPSTSRAGRDFVSGVLAHELSEGRDELAAFDRLLRLDAAALGYDPDPESVARKLQGGDALVAVLPLDDAERMRHQGFETLHYRHPESGSPVTVRGVAMLRAAPSGEWAREFIEMVGGDVAAEVAARTWWLPPRGAPMPGRLPDDHYLPGEALPWVIAPPATAAAAAWLERWDSEVRGKGRNFF